MPECRARIDFAMSKLTNVLSENRGYSKLTKIDSIINVEISKCKEDDELSREDWSYFKFSPIVPCDVERTFSKYKNMIIVWVLNLKILS